MGQSLSPLSGSGLGSVHGSQQALPHYAHPGAAMPADKMLTPTGFEAPHPAMLSRHGEQHLSAPPAGMVPLGGIPHPPHGHLGAQGHGQLLGPGREQNPAVAAGAGGGGGGGGGAGTCPTPWRWAAAAAAGSAWGRCRSCPCRGASRSPCSWRGAAAPPARARRRGGGGGSRRRPAAPCPRAARGRPGARGAARRRRGGARGRPAARRPAHGSPRAGRPCSPSPAARSSRAAHIRVVRRARAGSSRGTRRLWRGLGAVAARLVALGFAYFFFWWWFTEFFLFFAGRRRLGPRAPAPSGQAPQPRRPSARAPRHL